MVVFLLYLRANLEKIGKLEVPDGYEFCIDVKDSTGEDVREGVRVTSRNVEDLKDSKGQCNFQLKFVKDARRAAYLNVVPVKGVTRGLKAEDDRKWVPIIGFECRGMDVIGFHPEDGFQVESESGTRFGDVDLSEGEWVEYDEKLGDSVGIYDLEHKLQPHH